MSVSVVAGALAISHKKQDTIVGVVASIALVPTIAGVGITATVTEWQKVWSGLAMVRIKFRNDSAGWMSI